MSCSESWEIGHWESAGVGLCVAHVDGLVVCQNKICAKICGGQRGSHCNSGRFTPCRSRSIRSLAGEGTYRFAAESVDNAEFDVIAIQDSMRVVTIIYPLAAKRRREMQYFEHQNLSAKELEVVQILVARASRADISARLDITENTVKWYIRAITKKLSANGKQILRKIRADK